MLSVVRVTISAGPEAVWEVLADLPAWPRWTPTVTKVETPVPRPTTGARVVVTQPGRRPVGYLVEAVEPGKSFRWGSTTPGVRQWADHAVAPAESGGSEVTLGFGMTGWLGGPLAGLARGRIRRMIATEAASLKRWVEGRGSSS